MDGMIRTALGAVAACGVLFAPMLAAAAPLTEPVVFSSRYGSLDLLMIAQPAPLTTLAVAGYVPTAWSYQVCQRPWQGTYCPPGSPQPYAGVRLALQPGDTLRVRLVNRLPPVNPAELDWFGESPLLALNPTNLHTHGLVVDATPNTAIPPAIPVYGDFVFTSLFNPGNGDPAAVNPGAYEQLHAHGDVVKNGVVDYKILVPKTHPLGQFWFHPHIHGSSSNQIAAGLSGIITVGNTVAYACLDARCNFPIPQQFVRHLVIKDMQVVGPAPGRPQFQEDPGFCPPLPAASEAPRLGQCAADPAAYPTGGYWFFTVNGQQFPSIQQTDRDGEIWRLQNASASVSYDLKLVDDKTGQPVVTQLLSMDGVSVNIPDGTKAGDIVKLGGSRFRYVTCPGSMNTTAICITELFLMPAARAELWVSARDAGGFLANPTTPTSATLRALAYQMGPIGDVWPQVDLMKVGFVTWGKRAVTGGALTVRGDAYRDSRPGGIFKQARTDIARAPVPPTCVPLPAGYKRRVYFGNPGTGEDDAGHAIFGLGYELIDAAGQPVPGTFKDVARFNPDDLLCVPLGQGNTPVAEVWELVNLTGELHNFHIHQTKFKVVSATAPSGSVLASNSTVGDGIEEDTIPLPTIQTAGSYVLPDSGSCPVADYKAGNCVASPITIQIPFTRIGTFVYHCHILEHEDGGMMRPIRVVPAAR